MKIFILTVISAILLFVGFSIYACELGQTCTPDATRHGSVNLIAPYQGTYYCMFTSDEKERFVDVQLGGSSITEYQSRPIELVSGEFKKIVVVKRNNNSDAGKLTDLELHFHTASTTYGYLPLDTKFTCYKAAN